MKRGSSVSWFVVVGGAAALTHMAVFALAHERMWPELANALGFAVAFLVSFFGHRLLSFRDTSTTLRQSFGRFAFTALAGFACNEAVFVILLRGAGLHPFVALVLALGVAAVQTFALSRWWAFRR